jgi:hypothetical protein
MMLVRVQPVQLLLGNLPVRGDHEVNVVGLLVMGSTGCLGLPFDSVYMGHFFPVNDLMLQVVFDDSSEESNSYVFHRMSLLLVIDSHGHHD